MKNRKIVYLNTFAWGSAHEMYNASVLYMCAQLTDRLVCRTSKSNYQVMRHTLGDKFPSNVQFNSTPTIGGGGKYALLLRYIVGAVMDLVYLMCCTTRSTIVVMPFNNLFALKAINRLSKLLPRRILICCHGEMEAIASDINSKGLLSRILHRRCIRFFLNPKVTIARGIRFAVLGDGVRNNLGQYIDGQKMARFVSLDHPYIFSNRPPDKVRKLFEPPLKVGTAGAISRSKGLDGLIAYAKACRDKGLDVSIGHTGRVFEAESVLSQYVDLPATNGELSRNQYDERLSALDYMLFFYNPDGYKITASGAIMDALAIRKPIIALRNDYFEYLFEKFGTFGHLVDNLDQMVEITDRILSGALNEEFDFERIRSRLSPDAVQGQFDAIINQLADYKE